MAARIDKAAIFDRFARNLQLLRPEHIGRYCCPLTLSLFDRAALDDGRLTLEHCIPKGLGARKLVLTSKSANNQAGANIDSALHRMILGDEFFTEGIGELRTRLKMGDHEVGAVWKRDIDGKRVENKLQIIAELSNPLNVDASQEWAKNKLTMGNEISLTFTQVKPADRTLSRVALLKAGYLCLFHRLGYSYILHAALDVIRNQIRNSTESLLPLDKLVFEMKAQDYRSATVLVTEPKELVSYLVGIQIRKSRAAQPRYFGVILPASISAYGNWASASRHTLTMKGLPKDIDFIGHPQSVLFD